MTKAGRGPPDGLRVVFVCQAVDEGDPVLASTVRWIEALARQRYVDHVTALALRTGSYSLPANVDVRQFGRASRPATLGAFYRALTRSLDRRRGLFFVHQGGPYPALLLPLKLVTRIPIVQWKAHPVITRAMAFHARWCDDLVFTATAASFPIDGTNVRVVGHGIDTELFRPAGGARLGDLITVGRIAPRKRVDQMIRAVAQTNRWNGTGYRLNIYGPTLPGDEAYAASVENLVERLEARDWVKLHGPVRHERLPELLNGHRASLNFSETAVDKSVLEAMACGLPLISTNDSVAELVPRDLRPVLLPDKQSTEQQARMIHELLRRPDDEIDRLGARMRAVAVEDHSIDRLFDRILEDVAVLL